MFVAMEHLVGKQIAAARACVARREPLDESAIGRHGAERGEIVLARRAEQLRARAVVRGAKDDDQLGALAPAQLVVSPRVSRGAAARIDMRRDETGETSGRRRRGRSRRRPRQRVAAGRVGTFEERLYLGAQA